MIEINFTLIQDKDRPVGKLDTDGSDFSPVKEKLEHILANRASMIGGSDGFQNGSGSLQRSGKPSWKTEETNDVVTTIDTSTGSIVVDKTTKKQGKSFPTKCIIRVSK
jgi:hypothetical protein